MADRGPGGPGRTRRALAVATRYAGALALSGVGVAAGSLAELLVSETGGLFGFMESGYRPAIVLSIVLESVTIVLLGGHLLLRRDTVAPVPQTIPSRPREIS